VDFWDVPGTEPGGSVGETLFEICYERPSCSAWSSVSQCLAFVIILALGLIAMSRVPMLADLSHVFAI